MDTRGLLVWGQGGGRRGESVRVGRPTAIPFVGGDRSRAEASALGQDFLAQPRLKAQLAQRLLVHARIAQRLLVHARINGSSCCVIPGLCRHKTPIRVQRSCSEGDGFAQERFTAIDMLPSGCDSSQMVGGDRLAATLITRTP